MKQMALLFLITLAPLTSAASDLEQLLKDIIESTSIEIRFGNADFGLSAMDEHGRSCLLRDGRLVKFERDGLILWRLEDPRLPSAPACANGMVFRIDESTKRFLRVDHGFEEIFKYYARSACTAWIDEPGSTVRPITEEESQHLGDCLLKPKKWEAFKATLRWYLGQKQTGKPRRQACTQDLLQHENIRIACSDRFHKLASDSVFHDVIVIKQGNPQIRGGGSAASNYIVHPDFTGVIDLAGHSRVYHLARHKCVANDVFRGCIGIGGL